MPRLRRNVRAVVTKAVAWPRAQINAVLIGRFSTHRHDPAPIGLMVACFRTTWLEVRLLFIGGAVFVVGVDCAQAMSSVTTI